MGFEQILALIIVGAAVALVVKGWDVRLVLLGAALLIAAVAGDVPLVVREFLATFSNEKFVVPICSAMGFAYVLRHTGCDRHLVMLLINPLRHFRLLLVPGVIASGFIVNIPLVSQTSTAVCLGAVVVPLMRAAGYSMATIGACLLLGASIGGELLNPGAPELLTVFKATGVPTTTMASEYIPPLLFTQLAIAACVFWALSFWWEHKAKHAAAQGSVVNLDSAVASSEDQGSADKGGATSNSVTRHRETPAHHGASPFLSDHTAAGAVEVPGTINWLKAMIPFVPLVLLFAAAPPFNFIDIPDAWVIAPLPDGSRDPAYSSRLIGLAMLIGVLAAALVTPDKARDSVKEFFAGAGYGFANVVSLIVTANCFGKAIQAAGLASSLGHLIDRVPGLIKPLAAFVPLTFAAISGSGMASTQSLYGFFHDPAVALGLDPVAIGALVSLGSAAGRTMSPVAAVVLMCAALTQTNPFTLVRRVAVPLLTGITVVVLLRL
jgi:DcuC family C4-dicarboxylate transporter